METQTERRLAVKLDERDTAHSKLEELHRELDGGSLSEVQRKQAEDYVETMKHLDEEIGALSEQADADRRAVEKSKEIRRAMRVAVDGVDADDDGIVYRTMAAYARDVIVTGQGREVSKIGAMLSQNERQAAAQRLDLLKRTPANTLSSNVEGLIPDQHIAQIFQVIDTSRPIVASAQRSTLERGTLTYPKVTTRPIVAVQSAEKTEAGNQGMVIDMQTTTASTYLGGGDLSWQAIQWSSPNALELWFRLVAADYALKTEQDAAQALQHSGFTYNISATLGALTDFSDILAAISAGAGDVYANSSRVADTIYMAPNALYALAAVASTESANFATVGGLSLGSQGGTLLGLNVVVSRGMDSGVIVVGDSDGLLVAETAGAPVELRVVEPAIGGVEVGLIGAFEAVVVDAGAFAMITTAS